MARRVRAPALLLALLASGVARANPADTFGLGARSTALAGAVAADVRDYSANYYNPSGLVRARGTDLSVGYMYVSHRLTLNGQDSQVDPVRGLTGGLVAPGAVGPIPFAFGIGVHLADDRLSRARTIRPGQPRWVMYDNRPQLLYLSANLAVQPIYGVSIGGGISFLAATRGAFNITGTAVLPDGRRTEYDSQLRHEVDADLTAVRYPQAGITVTPSDTLSLALVYRGEAKIGLDIAADLNGEVDAGFLTVPAQYTLDSQTTNAFIPQQVVVGAAYDPVDRLQIELDLTYVDWSSYESPVSRSKTDLDVEVPGGLVELPTNPKPTKVEDAGFQDRVVPRVGIEYRLRAARQLDLPLRVGYLYEHSPVPSQTGSTDFVDTNRHVLSGGAGFIWKDPGEVLPGNLRFDTYLQWSILPTRVTLKDNPANFVGDYRASGNIINVGMNLSVGFR